MLLTFFLIPYINNQLEAAKGVDLVWDTYHACSINESARVKRGNGIRWKVAGKSELPHN